MIGDNGPVEEARELELAVTVGRAHHGDLDTLVAVASFSSATNIVMHVRAASRSDVLADDV